MKKTLRFFLVTALLVTLLCLPVLAAGQPSYVVDKADLLTDEQEQTLTKTGAELSERYQCGVYIVTMQDFIEETGMYDVEDAAEALYLDGGLGMTEDRSGILLLLSMEERDWAMFAFGYGNTAFTDYGKRYLSESFLDDFKKDSWYDGLTDYQKRCGQMIERAQKGDPVDVNSRPTAGPAKIISAVICVVLGFGIGGIVFAVLKSQLKSVAKATDARNFVDETGLQLTDRQDRYTYTSTHRVYDPPSSSSSSSGGGTTTRSSGGSSASGKF